MLASAKNMTDAIGRWAVTLPSRPTVLAQPKHCSMRLLTRRLVARVARRALVGLNKFDQLLTLSMAAYELMRLRGLAQLRPQCAQ